MKSKTSFFNGYALKKDITRFAPVWGLYSVYLAVMLLMFSGSQRGGHPATGLEFLIRHASSINFLYAAVCAVTLLGDLYIPRLCNALHAMPLRRESWFVAHTVSGLLFSLIPNLAAALILLPSFSGCPSGPFLWLGANMLQFAFFYGLALFCGCCAGTRIGLLSLYGMLNFLSQFAYAAIDIFFRPLLYGIVFPYTPFRLLCPPIQMSWADYLDMDYLSHSRRCRITGFTSGSWSYLMIAAGVGILLALLGLLLYRRRHLERAGDLLAFRMVRPLYLFVVSFGSGLLLFLFTGFFTGAVRYAAMLIGITVGYFVCQMQLHRTVRVFRMKTIGGFLLLLAIMAGSLGLAYWDPAGLVTRVPAAAHIESCTLSIPYQDGVYVADSQPDLETIRAMHNQIVKERPRNRLFDSDSYDYSESTVLVRIHYRLKNGRTMDRSYSIPISSPALEPVRRFMSSWQVLLGEADPGELTRKIDSCSLDLFHEDIWDVPVPKSRIPDLLEAIAADCREGTMAQGFTLHAEDPEIGKVSLQLSSGTARQKSIVLRIYQSCTHTGEFLAGLNQ